MMQAAETIGPMTPDLLAALEARGFDAEAFLKLDPVSYTHLTLPTIYSV